MEKEDENITIVNHILEHIAEWKDVVSSPADVTITRLSGLSNACYRVEFKPHLVKPGMTLTKLLYRRFEQDLTDKRIEQAIFKTKSEDGTGPKLYFQNNQYRIEGFFDGRPLSIWEMRNQIIYLNYAELMVEFNFSSVAWERIQAIKPKDPNDLFIHQVINEWGPNLLAKIEDIKANLKAAG